MPPTKPIPRLTKDERKHLKELIEEARQLRALADELIARSEELRKRTDARAYADEAKISSDAHTADLSRRKNSLVNAQEDLRVIKKRRGRF
jgi:hypothetical protein